MRTGRLLLYEGWDLPDGTSWDPVRWTNPGGAGSTINVQSGGGRIAMAGVTANYGEYGSMSVDGVVTPDFEVTVDVVIANVTAESYAKMYVGDSMVATLAGPNNGFGWQIILDVNTQFHLQKCVGGVNTNIGRVNVPITAGLTYRVRFRREGSFISGRIWDVTTAEPNDWTASTIDWDFRGPGYSLLSCGAVNGAVAAAGENVTYDNLAVYELVPGARRRSVRRRSLIPHPQRRPMHLLAR